MSTPVWQPGRLYSPGSIVLPRTVPASEAFQITNPDFELGDTGWTKGPGWAINNQAGYSGGWCAMLIGEGQGRKLISGDRHPVKAGQRFQAQCYVQPTRSSDSAALLVVFFNESGGVVSEQQGTMAKGNHGWRVSKSGNRDGFVVPGGATHVALGVIASKYTSSFLGADSFSWSLRTEVQAGLMYRAVQAESGYSGTNEPVWPGILGQQVADNEVMWESISITRVVWQARPILRSGATQPVWPTSSGGRVADGRISWEAVSRSIEDPNCPNSPVTTIIASKVFKADGDIVRFSATANPRDWTTPQDAGYLPTGLQQANANDAAALAPYRSNLAVFNASSFQMWQVDPDPEAMAIIDQMDGIGSSWQQAAQPVANDLFYLSQLGVRTVGIANAAENLAAGDVGSPVDELVRAEIAAGGRVLSTYYPGAGQFWLAFARPGATSVHVYSMARAGQAGAWSRYELPFAVEAFAQLGDDLYIRHGNSISVVSEGATQDEVGGALVNFPGVVWWPWLDFGAPGQTKMLEGFDYVGTGQGPSISIGYDQRSNAAFTPAYQIVNDTMPGGMVPIPVAAPTLSVKLSFAGGEKWNVQSVLLSVLPMQGGP